MDAIDSFRGFASLWVLAVHAMYTFRGPYVPDGYLRPVGQVVGIGYLGVTLFLVLSGFCLFYPVAAKGQEWRVAARRFFARRFRRIAPPYYASIPLAVAAGVLIGRTSFKTLLDPWWTVPAHLLFVQNLLPATVARINGVYWSLGLEFQLYLVFPALVWAARRAGLLPVAFVALGMGFAWEQLVRQYVGPRYFDGYGFTVWNALPARLWDFTCGMLAAYSVAPPRRRHRVAAAAVVLIGLPVGVWLSYLPPGLIPAAAPFEPMQHRIWAPTFAALAVLACTTPARIWAVTAPVGWFSYSLYLVHVPIFQVIRWLGQKYEVHLPYLIPVACSVSIVSTTCSTDWWNARSYLTLVPRRASRKQDLIISLLLW